MYLGNNPYRDLNDTQLAQFTVSKFFQHIFDPQEAAKEDDRMEERKKIALETGHKYFRRRKTYHWRCLVRAKGCALEALTIFVSDLARGRAIAAKIDEVVRPSLVPTYWDSYLLHSSPRVMGGNVLWPIQSTQVAQHELARTIVDMELALANVKDVDRPHALWFLERDPSELLPLTCSDVYNKHTALIGNLENILRVSDRSPLYLQRCRTLNEMASRQNYEEVNIERLLLAGYLEIAKEFQIAEGLSTHPQGAAGVN